MRRYVFFILISFVVGCSTIAPLTTSSKYNYRDITNTKYIGNYSYIYNIDSTYVVCRGKLNNLSNNTSFFIYSINKNRIIFETIHDVTYIKWSDKYIVEYEILPEIVTKSEKYDNINYIDVISPRGIFEILILVFDDIESSNTNYYEASLEEFNLKRLNMKKIYTLIVVFTIASFAYLYTDKQETIVIIEKNNVPSSFSQKKSLVKGISKQDSPNLFADYYNEIRTEIGDDYSNYPNNYLVTQFRNAKIGVSISKKKSLNWVSRGPGNVGGRSRGLIIDPDDPTGNTWFIAAVGGGVWKTTNAGIDWVILTSDIGSLSASYMAMSSSQHDIIYLGTGEGFGNLDELGGQGMWKSTDRGNTWKQLTSTVNSEFGIINRIIIDPSNPKIVLASTSISNNSSSLTASAGIWKSVDGGENWIKKFSNERKVQQIISDPSDFSIQYASVNGVGVFKSINGGDSWVKTSGLSATGRIELAISESDSNRLYASVSDLSREPSAIYVTSNKASSWTKCTSNINFLGGQGWYDNAIIVDPYDKDVLFVAGVGIFKIKYNGGSKIDVTIITDNYGSNGSVINKGTHVDNHYFAVFKLNNSTKKYRLVGTNDGGVCYSDDKGSSFTQPNSGFITTQFYGVDKANGKDLYFGGMQDNSCFVSIENTTKDDNWSFVFGGDGFDVIWNYDDDKKVMLTSQFNNIAITHSGIADLKTKGWLADVDSGKDDAPFITTLAQSKQFSDLVFTCSKGGIWKTEDFGKFWKKIEMPFGFKGDQSSTQLKISLADPSIVWAGSSLSNTNPMYVSTDYGHTFSPEKSSIINSWVSGLATHPTDKNTAYALFSTSGNPKIMRTTDLGKNWTDISGFSLSGDVSTNGFPNVAVFDLLVMPFNTDILWAGTELGIFESLDNGVTWKYSNNGLPPVAVYDMLIVNDEVVIGTHGRGVWTVSLPELNNYEPLDVVLPVKVTSTLTFNANGQHSNLKLEYRSNYDNVTIIVNNVDVINYTDVTSGGSNLTEVDINDGENKIIIKATVNGQEYYTKLSVTGLPLLEPVNSYIDNFNTSYSIRDDFFGKGFRISKPSGFSNKAINTSHPYSKAKDIYLYLRTPVIVNEEHHSIMYKDIAIVEIGDPGTAYPNSKFWDYVTVEGSTDGENWKTMIVPYDANYNSKWKTIYNTKDAIPGSNDFKKHTIDIHNYFNTGDVILIRFKLHSDAASTGWGWIIDDLEIQKGALSLEDNYLSTTFRVYPNPVVDEVLYLESTTDSKITKIEIYNLSGQVLLNMNFNNVEKAKLNISNFATGQYLMKVETDKGSFSKKLMVK